jgi:4-cresol dehydrogenase (hydroxylating)
MSSSGTTVMNVCSVRFARGLHVITFNREDADERARADACYRTMSEEVGARGVFVGRAPVDYHDFHMRQAMPAPASKPRLIQTARSHPAVTASRARPRSDAAAGYFM